MVSAGITGRGISGGGNFGDHSVSSSRNDPASLTEPADQPDAAASETTEIGRQGYPSEMVAEGGSHLATVERT